MSRDFAELGREYFLICLNHCDLVTDLLLYVVHIHSCTHCKVSVCVVMIINSHVLFYREEESDENMRSFAGKQ